MGLNPFPAPSLKEVEMLSKGILATGPQGHLEHPGQFAPPPPLEAPLVAPLVAPLEAPLVAPFMPFLRRGEGEERDSRSK